MFSSNTNQSKLFRYTFFFHNVHCLFQVFLNSTTEYTQSISTFGKRKANTMILKLIYIVTNEISFVVCL